MNTGQTERKFCTSAEWDVWEAEQRAAEKPAKESEHEIIVRDQYGILPEEKPEILGPGQRDYQESYRVGINAGPYAGNSFRNRCGVRRTQREESLQG